MSLVNWIHLLRHRAAVTQAALGARELRHATPFAGVLSAGEHAAVYRAFADGERGRRET